MAHSGTTRVFVKGHPDVVRLLIETGTGKDTATDSGAAPVASHNGQLDVVRLGAGQTRQQTSVFVARQKGHHTAVNLLIDKSTGNT